MAVKVMIAPAIVRGEIERGAPAPRRRAAAPGKARRRRSAVYDADGNEVFITLVCLKCRKVRPLSLFGLRRMPDGSIRNQPWCRSCRSGASAGRNGGLAAEDSSAAEGSLESAPSPDPAAAAPRRNVAAEVAAALAAARR
jgi:hypothetical protein